MCDITIASENAMFGQTGPKVGSFDAGFGASYLARIVGQKKAREIWFMCRLYTAQQAEQMGMVNKVVPFVKLEDEVVDWAETMMERSPLALRMIKAGLNAELDGQAGIQQLAGDATMLYYMLDEAQTTITEVYKHGIFHRTRHIKFQNPSWHESGHIPHTQSLVYSSSRRNIPWHRRMRSASRPFV